MLHQVLPSFVHITKLMSDVFDSLLLPVSRIKRLSFVEQAHRSIFEIPVEFQSEVILEQPSLSLVLSSF